MKDKGNIISRLIGANCIIVPITLALTATAHAAAPLSEIAIGPVAGTPGFGVAASVPLWPHYINLTSGYQDFGITYNASVDGQGYNASLRLGGVPVFISLYPLGSAIHLDAGIFINNNRISWHAIADGGNFVFDGHSYSAKIVGAVTGSTHYDRVAPYLGVGWGDPFKGNSNWTFTANAGVILEGGSNAQFNAAHESEVPGAADALSAVAQSFNNNTRFLTALPVVNIGLTYRF